jgi:hypothetical protein
MQDRLAPDSNILIHAEMIDSLRDGLRGRLATAAQELTYADELAGGSEHPERYLGPLRYIDALRALLDEIGWSGPASDLRIDLRTHDRALLLALDDQISGQADLLRDSVRADRQRESVAFKMNGLLALAFVALMKTRMQIPLAGTRPICCPGGESRAGYL